MLIFCLFLLFKLTLLNILGVSVDPASGSYALSVNGVNWFTSGPTGYVSGKKWVLSPQSLKVKNITIIEGSDKHDNFTKTSIFWRTLLSQVTYVTSFYEYHNLDVILFLQDFPIGLTDSSVSGKNTDLSTMFPSFQNALPGSTSLHYHTNQNTFCVPLDGKWSDLTFTGGALSGPIAFYTNETTVLMSPKDTFMVGNYVGSKFDGDVYTVGGGLQGKVTTVPPEFRYTSMIVGSNEGMTSTYMKWGDYLLDEYSKRRTEVPDDVFLEKLGYWTDNGAYYYYITEPDKNYEETILDVWSDIQSRGLPVGTIQYDSWWYYKSDDDGLYEWVTRPDIFPDGMEYIDNKLGIPVGLHNRWFGFENAYNSKMNYSFYEGDGCSLPRNQDVFDYIMGLAKGWGMTLYEQDWLSKTYSNMEVVQNNTRIGGEWMMHMANAAKGLDLTIQLCMPYPAHMLQTLPMGNVVTHARASNDYNPRRNQWAIGQTSLFYWAMGVVPFKDNFWTTDKYESRCKYTICYEANPDMQAVVASLSMGPVGFSDKIGMGNDHDLVLETCTADGTLLKTDRPAFTLDEMYQRTFDDWEGVNVDEVWGTYTCFDGIGCWVYILAIDLTVDITLTVDMLPSDLPSKSTEYFAVQYTLGEEKISDLIFFSKDDPIVLEKSKWHPITDLIGWEMYVFAPKMHSKKDGCEWNFIKEMKKIVSASSRRVTSMMCDGENFSMLVSGSEGEEVTFAMLDLNGSLMYPSCSFTTTGQMKLTCQNGKCTC